MLKVREVFLGVILSFFVNPCLGFCVGFCRVKVACEDGFFFVDGRGVAAVMPEGRGLRDG